jgi:hypothetical protein
MSSQVCDGVRVDGRERRHELHERNGTECDRDPLRLYFGGDSMTLVAWLGTGGKEFLSIGMRCMRSDVLGHAETGDDACTILTL